MGGQPQEIRVQADYECYALWFGYPDYENVSPYDSRLGLSPQLANELDQWADWFTGTICMEDASLIGFSSNDEERRFMDQGFNLAIRTQRELGHGWQVYYFDHIEKVSRLVGDV